MTNRMEQMRKFFITDKAHHKYRQPKLDSMCLAEQFSQAGMDDVTRAAKRLEWVLEAEKPVVFEEEKIAFLRTLPNLPEIFTEQEAQSLKEQYWIHEKGEVCNICVDYTKLLSCGFDAKIAQLEVLCHKLQAAGQEKNAREAQLQIDILEAVQNLADRYQKTAQEQGNQVVAQTLLRVPRYAPANFLEALQMLRIIHFTMWCGGNYHNTLGRFDQYLFPYFWADMENGSYTRETALELLEEFFLTFNRDSDLYPGMQQGDNGQSMVLGGLKSDGTDGYNLLSELCLRASLELKLIDPKINLRVHKNTPLSAYLLGTQLTKQGLGFPQYSNDDVVIPGLVELGYRREDAMNYVVAACWEFIIPGAGMDIPNIEALSFSGVVETVVMENLETAPSYEVIRQKVQEKIFEETARLRNSIGSVYIYPAPFLSLMMDGCSDTGRDISLGGVYNNYGIHGTGIATAADSLAAVRKYVFDEKTVTAQRMLAAIKTNFADDLLLQNQLRYEAPKMGNNIDYVDEIAVDLLADFADSLVGQTNDRGGIYRAGTGSAMYYIWHSKDLPATPDGRSEGEGIAANYSPSLFSRCKGPVSIIRSFVKPDLKRVINGGPLTLELHDTVFRTEESMEKVALLVKSFMDLGGHQLQLNSVNRETMLDAQKHPENYRNLIVRVWGWSGYFVELDREYQDHIIKRMELVV